MATMLSNKCLSAKVGVAARKPARATVVVRASAQVDRRAALAGLVAAGASLVATAPAQAAFGDSANVFGRVTNKTGFVPYAGDNFAVLLPSKWNPSKEREYTGVVLRYEDNFDAVNNMVVIQDKASKGSIEDYGSPENFLKEVSFLLGKQAFSGETISEGGFAPGRVSAASLLGTDVTTDKKGKKYYVLDVLTRTADGDEGGRHQIIKATISGGNLWILKAQAGDKRWFKGTKKEIDGIVNSFTVA